MQNPTAVENHRTQPHAAAARLAAAALVEANRLGDARKAQRHMARLRRHLDAHLAQVRAERWLDGACGDRLLRLLRTGQDYVLAIFEDPVGTCPTGGLLRGVKLELTRAPTNGPE